MYVFMPETENRTLEEVERYYSDTYRKVTDRRIPVMGKQSEINAAFTSNELVIEKE